MIIKEQITLHADIQTVTEGFADRLSVTKNKINYLERAAPSFAPSRSEMEAPEKFDHDLKILLLFVTNSIN